MSHSSPLIATLGTPRIGPRRELKLALENYWSGKSDENALLTTAAALRVANWARQKALGITVIPSNDFSLYDHVLDTSIMVGAIPENYGWSGGPVPLATYFAMARGLRGSTGHKACAHDHGGEGNAPCTAAQEMTKWFDTNYHYMVPEFSRRQRFVLSSLKPIDEYREAKALGYRTRPVLLGPVTYLRLGKSREADFDPLVLLDDLLRVYVDVLRRLADAGAEWVQLDEPCLVLDLDEAARRALQQAYAAFAQEVPGLKIMLATYFGELGDNLTTALSLPVAGLHLDLVRAPHELDAVASKAPPALVVSLGVIDGRNVWRANLPAVLDRIEPVVAGRGIDRVQIAPSCSLLHVPIDVEAEQALDPDLKSWLAFSVQKMSELAALGSALTGGRATVHEALAASSAAADARMRSPKVHDAAVVARAGAVNADMARRRSGFAVRSKVQRRRFSLPTFPTTTIGSFPQTAAVRKARAAHT